MTGTLSVVGEDRAVFTLRLLASGLVEAYEGGLLQPRPLPPYNNSLQRGANRLAVDLLLAGQASPTDLATLFRFCHKPLHQWGLRLPAEAAYGQLLVDGVPTDTCHDWAVKSTNPEWELVAQLLPKLMDECRFRGKPEWYSRVRMELIKHPVLDGATELRWHLDDTMGELADCWSDAYERIPEHLAHAGEIWCCGYCGWTMERDSRGLWHCGHNLCAQILGDHGHKATRRRKNELTRRLRAPLRRFVLIPGIPELALGDWLEEQGLAPSFWPNYDRCDLSISFSDGEEWDVDVKDWAVPFRLAAAIREKEQAATKNTRRLIYVVPDHRERLFPGYERGLRNALGKDGPEAMRMRRFKQMVKRKLKGEGTHA